jgi:hypothetical protein
MILFRSVVRLNRNVLLLLDSSRRKSNSNAFQLFHPVIGLLNIS